MSKDFTVQCRCLALKTAENNLLNTTKSQTIFQKYKESFHLSKEDNKLISNLIFDHDRPLYNSEFHKELYNSRYGNDLELLFMLKKADILASNPNKHDEYLKKLRNNE